MSLSYLHWTASKSQQNFQVGKLRLKIMAIETKCRTLTGKISQISLALAVKSVTVTFIKNEKNIFCVRKRQKELYRIFSKFIIELQSKHQKFYKTTFFRRELFCALLTPNIISFLYFSSQSLQRT